jgi:hypothetical protein
MLMLIARPRTCPRHLSLGARSLGRLLAPAPRAAGGSSDVLPARFWSRAAKAEEQSEPWPVSSGTVAKQLVVKPLATGAGYGTGAFLASLVAMPAGLPGLAQLGIIFITTNVAFGVGSSVGTITGATTCLVEGKWLVRALPIRSVTKTVGGGKKLSTKAVESLALTLKDALASPSFVPWMARPFWSFAMNQAIPLDSLLLVPNRILQTIEEKPNAAMGAVVEAVLLAVVAEGLGNLKQRYRWWGLGGVATIYGACVSGAVWLWPSVAC